MGVVRTGVRSASGVWCNSSERVGSSVTNKCVAAAASTVHVAAAALRLMGGPAVHGSWEAPERQTDAPEVPAVPAALTALSLEKRT